MTPQETIHLQRPGSSQSAATCLALSRKPLHPCISLAFLPSPSVLPRLAAGPQSASITSPHPRCLQNKHKLAKGQRSFAYRKVRALEIPKPGKITRWLKGRNSQAVVSRADLIYVSVETWVNCFHSFLNMVTNYKYRCRFQTDSVLGFCLLLGSLTSILLPLKGSFLPQALSWLPSFSTTSLKKCLLFEILGN